MGKMMDARSGHLEKTPRFCSQSPVFSFDLKLRAGVKLRKAKKGDRGFDPPVPSPQFSSYWLVLSVQI